MSLKVFHLVFVLASALLCGGVSWWLHTSGAASFGSASLVVAVFSASVSGMLMFYFVRTLKLQVT